MNPTALHKLGYGMYVIGARKDGKLNAQIANTLFQITSEPPTVAVSINKSNFTHDFIKESRAFSASVLCQGTPLSFIGHFGFQSGRDVDKLEGINYKIGQTEAPVILDHAVAYMEARVINEVDVGTHTIFIGEIVDADVLTDEECLTYEHYHQIKRGTTPKAAPTHIEEEKQETSEMKKYECIVCGYVYDPKLGDPEWGIKPGIPFEELPDDWKCPVCGASKSEFKEKE